MKWLKLTVPLFAVAIARGAVPAVAQDVETTVSAVPWDPSSRVLPARLVPPAGALANRDVEEPTAPLLPVGMTAARGGRPWWLIPVLATAGGALVYELVRGDECEDTDCIIYIPPPLAGAVLGLAVGTVIEVTLRLSSR